MTLQQLYARANFLEVYIEACPFEDLKNQANNQLAEVMVQILKLQLQGLK